MSNMDDLLISPSKARRDAARARDWSYVTNWLAQKYAPQPVPRFERNEDVLQSLLALVAANDAADAEAQLVHRARAEELERFAARQRDDAGGDPVQRLLGECEASLDGEGVEALRDLADANVCLGTLRTDAATLGERMLEVAREGVGAREQLRRVEASQAYLEREMAVLEADIAALREARGDEGSTENLRQQTAQYARDTKQVSAKLAEYRSRIAALEKAGVMAGPRIEDVKGEEREVVALQSRVRGLEKRLGDYYGLPPDLEAAKEELNRAQGELRSLTRQRDELFDEGLTRTRS